MENIDKLIDFCLDNLSESDRKNPLILSILLEKFQYVDNCLNLTETNLIYEDLFNKSLDDLMILEGDLLFSLNERKKRRPFSPLKFAKLAGEKLQDNLKNKQEQLQNYKSKDDGGKNFKDKIERLEDRIDQNKELIKANKIRQKIEKDKEQNK